MPSILAAASKPVTPNTEMCRLCGGLSSVHWKKAGFLKCRSCGLLCRDTVPKESTLRELYDTGWQNPCQHTSETGGTDLALARIYVLNLARSLGIENFNGFRLLDFGAGSGATLTALSEQGAEVTAVEPFGYDHLRRKGFRVYRALDQIPAGSKFDGILTLEVIEHLQTPWETLAQFGNLLKNGGWIFVATPNAGGLNARLNRSEWREAKKTGHLMFFNPSSLELLFRHCGYSNYRRLYWRMAYADGFLSKVRDYSLQSIGLDGALRYLALKA